MKIKVLNKSEHPLPEYSTEVSAGMDLRAKPDTVLSSPGTIDADYQGEVCIILVNLSNETFVIKDGGGICQMVIAKHEKAEWERGENLQKSARGTGGFGHTGKY